MKPQLPDKLYFKIGEVGSIVGVKPYVLRYWESQFSITRPSKPRSRHRLSAERCRVRASDAQLNRRVHFTVLSGM